MLVCLIVKIVRMLLCCFDWLSGWSGCCCAVAKVFCVLLRVLLCCGYECSVQKNALYYEVLPACMCLEYCNLPGP